jgi:hypothetical protein
MSDLSRFAFFPRPTEQSIERKQSGFNERRRGWGMPLKVEQVRQSVVFVGFPLFRPRARGTSLYSFLVSVSVFSPSAWNEYSQLKKLD